MPAFEAGKREILNWVAETLQIPVERIDLSKPFAELGLDSLDAVHMIATIESIIRQELPEDVMQRFHCLGDIFGLMQEKLAA